MSVELDALEPAELDRLTTLLVQSGHLNHPLRLQAHVETALSPEQVKSALAATLPTHMVPDQIIPAGKLPRLPSGKLDRARLAAPDSGQTKSTGKPEQDTSHSLKTLREIWADVLGVDQIFDEDDFFELGGDSLLSISVVSRARSAGLEIIPSDLFDYPTLKELATRTAPTSPDTPLSDVSAAPLDFSIQGDATQQIFILNANRRMLEALNDQLDQRRKLHLLTLHWDNANVDRRTSVASIAAEFIARIRTMQPSGPYALGGFSMGAVAAHEIAHQLTEQGEFVTDLLLIDPPENPNLFAKPYNPEHKYEPQKEGMMTLRRRLVTNSVLTLSALLSGLRLPVPPVLKSRLVGATYLRAAKRYDIAKPVVDPTIVRRKLSQETSIWARAGEMKALHQIDCTHHNFHRDEPTIRQWTGLLAQSLNSKTP